MMTNLSKLFRICAGFKTYDYQDPILYDPTTKIIVNKPRQCGVSTTYQFKGLMDAIRGKQVLVTSKGEKEAKKFIRKAKLMYKNLANYIEEDFIETDRTEYLGFKSQGSLEALSNTSSSGRSYSADVIYLDEFAFYDNAKELYTAILPTITTKKEYQIVIISTPNGEANLYADMWMNATKYGYKKVLIEMKNVPELYTEEKIRDIKKSFDMDELKFRQEYCNEFLGTQLAYFPMDIIRPCIDKELVYWNYPEQVTQKLIFGVDIGAKRDKFAIVGINEDGEVKYFKTLERVSFEEMKRELKALIPVANAIKIEENAIGQQISEELKAEAPEVIIPITTTNQVNADGFVGLRKMFETKTIKIPDIFELSRALNLIERKQVGTVFRFDAPRTDETGHSDSADALMLAVYKPPIREMGVVGVDLGF